jgi:charged multivesicular body protein 2A
MAKDGQMAVVKTMAKDLVRTRAQVTKFYQMKCQMQAVGLRLQTIKSTQSMTEAMKGAAKAMKGMNAKVNAPEMAKILMEFEKQSDIMDSKQEMMDDTIDEAFEAEDEESQVEEVVGQVLAEIGIDLNGELNAPAAGGVTAKVGEELDDELDARLRALKGPGS